jgi:hypothetical protein
VSILGLPLSLFCDQNLILVKWSQALVSFKIYMPPPLPYFNVNIYPFPLPHFASIFFAYLWSFRWPNYIVTLLRYFSFRLPHLNISTGPPSDELDKNSQRAWHSEYLSDWNGNDHGRNYRRVLFALCVCVWVWWYTVHNVLCFLFYFFFLLCTLYCQFLWIVNFWLPLRYSLTFIKANEGVASVEILSAIS